MDLIQLMRDPEAYVRRLGDVMERARTQGHDDVEGTAGLAMAAFDRLFGPGSPAIATDCKAGCSVCCGLMVSATAGEILTLAAAIRAMPQDKRDAMTARVAASAPVVAGMDRDARRALARPCPVLEPDGRCGAYAARPLACRGIESFDVTACRAAMEGRETEVPLSGTHLKAKAAVEMAMAGALAARGRDAAQIELVQGLSIALTRADAGAAWLAGEDVFASARVPGP